MSQKIASRSQLLGLAGMLVQHMPADLSVEIAQEWADDPEGINQLLATMRDGSIPIGQIKRRMFEVTIFPKRTVEEWVDAGNYNYRNPNFTTGNFGQFLTVKKGATEPYKATVVAYCLGRSAKIDRAKRIRSRLNLKPVGFEHLAAIGEQHPKAQQELDWIVDPDLVWVDPRECRYVSYLYGNPGRRSLSLYDAGFEWDGDAWFVGLGE